MGTATVFDLSQVIEHHDGLVRRGDYLLLGRMVAMVLEPAAGAPTPPRDITRKQGIRLDWFDTGPMLAMSRNHVDILVVGKVPVLPPMPDPNWEPPVIRMPEHVTPEYEREIMKQLRAPKIPQRLEELASARIRNTKMLVFQPVATVLFRPLTVPTYNLLVGGTDLGSGTKPAFVWNLETGRGYFYGGTFQIQGAKG